MKFENSQYSKIWDSSEGRQITTTILNNPDLIKANHTFWATKFRVDPKITPANQEGEAVFISRMRELQSGVMLDMRAPLGDSIPVDKKGLAYYSGVIPDFIARGYVEKATERKYKEDLFEQFGDAALVAAYATDELQRMVDSANQTLSHMSAQLLSKGNIVYNVGEGLKGNLLKADIPAENFINAGAKVWTDTTARLLDQMRKIEEDFKDNWGVDMAMQWEITREMFNNCFLNNEQVIEWVRYTNLINNVPLPETLVLTEEMVMAALPKFQGISPIVIIEEKQKDINQGIVHGWAAGKAVLRPAGYAGFIRHTSILDEIMYKKYGNNLITRNFSKAINGIATVMNSVVNNGNLKEWHTDLMLSAIPSLDEFLYHIIVDTTTADE